MCMSCNCDSPTEKHDAAAIDWADLTAAAADAGIDPRQAAENIMAKTAMMVHKASWDDLVAGCEVFKAVEERRYTLGVAYPANRPDVGVAMDGHIDFVTPEVLEKAAWSFMRSGAAVGLHHADGTDGAGTVVESYLWPGEPWPQPNGYVVQKGDWLLGVQWGPEAWSLIKSGKVRGFSPQGGAHRRSPSSAALAALRDARAHL